MKKTRHGLALAQAVAPELRPAQIFSVYDGDIRDRSTSPKVVVAKLL